MRKRIFLILWVLCGGVLPLLGQNVPNWFKSTADSNYIEDHTHDITFRLYGSRKYTYYDIVDTKTNRKIEYRPNSNFNVGFGFNYKWLGINLGFNLPFINDNDDKYGKTKYLDLQSHVYLRKLVIDFYGQYYKGYYLDNPKKVLRDYNPAMGFPLRPDLYNLDLGLSVQYILNDQRFSYRAAYLQNEYQKKSAGSFIMGGEIFAVKIKADSSLVPTNIADSSFLRDQHYYRTGIISAAINAGYAYTFVYQKHLFLTLSLTGGLGINHTTLYMVDGYTSRDGGWQLNNTIRVSAGYNSTKYFAGIHYVSMITRSEMPIPHTFQTFGTGNFRVSLVRRFTLKGPIIPKWNF
jgi:hypothetical protein